jgi:hypothetical protein
VAPSGVPYVMLLTKDYSYVVMISGRDRTWESTIIFIVMTYVKVQVRDGETFLTLNGLFPKSELINIGK